MIWAVSDIKESFLLSIFHGSRKYYASFQVREAFNQTFNLSTWATETKEGCYEFEAILTSTM